MRRPLLLLAVLAMPGVVAILCAPARAGVDPAELERAWHRCLREAYTHQPPGQSRAGDQRNALDACREREDAYVAALMAAPGRGERGLVERGLGARAMGWAASVAASVLDPVTAWLRGLGR